MKDKPADERPVPYAFRLPKPKCVDPYFGGARTFWNEAILPCESNGFKPPVKSIVHRKRGCTRGIRFILFESAVDYFRRLEKEQEAEVTQAGPPKQEVA